MGVPIVEFVRKYKFSARANVVASMQIIGDVKDKNVVIIDDMVVNAVVSDKGKCLCNDLAEVAGIG